MAVDIFSLGQQHDAFKPKEKRNVELYRPSPDKGQKGYYEAVIRFVPNINARSVEDMILSKRIGWITDPATNDAKYVDCPSSVGQKSILSDIYWKLHNSKRLEDQELKKKFSTNLYHFTLIQVVEDKNQPDLEGRILVWKFGKSIKEKIDLEINPRSERAKKRMPYDLFHGRAFRLIIEKKGEWPNYDLSAFEEEEQPLLVNGVAIDEDTYDAAEVRQFLLDNSPDLYKYGFQEWDEETRIFVVNAIAHTVPQNGLVESIARRASASTNASASTSADADVTFGDNGFTDDVVASGDSDFEVDMSDIDVDDII